MAERERVIRIWVWSRDPSSCKSAVHWPWCNSLSENRWRTREAAVEHGFSIAFRRLLKSGVVPDVIRFEVVDGRPETKT